VKRVAFLNNNANNGTSAAAVVEPAAASKSKSTSIGPGACAGAGTRVAPPNHQLQQAPGSGSTHTPAPVSAPESLAAVAVRSSSGDVPSNNAVGALVANLNNASATTAAPVHASSSGTSTSSGAGGGILADSSRAVWMNGQAFTRLNVLGKGGSSCVYRIIGHQDGQVYAYKRVDVRDSDDIDSVFDSYANEIDLLRRLSSTSTSSSSSVTGAASSTSTTSTTTTSSSATSRIIELVDYEVSREGRYIAMLLEAGDVDLAKVLTQRNKAAAAASASATATSASGSSSSSSSRAPLLDPFFARMVWREMLEAVHHIHEHRIVHGDLKPANFVFVKGHLKLIDFGIAKSFNSDTTNIYRESQIGTVNYMAPEAIAPMESMDAATKEDEEDEDGDDDDQEVDNQHNGMKKTKKSKGGNGRAGFSDQERMKMRLGRASDIWSLGCILYQMIYGRPPFAALNTIQKLTTIPSPKHVITYASWGDAAAVESMRCCLVHDPRKRAKIPGPDGLLNMCYLQVQSSSTASSSAALRVGTTVNAGEGALTTAVSVATNTAEDSILPSSLIQAAPESAAAASPAAQTAVEAAIGPEQLHCIVGAVLDSLSNVAQRAVVKAQATGRTAGVSTRVTRRSNNKSAANEAAQAAEKLAKAVVTWLDEVDQSEIEEEVDEVVKEQEWHLQPLVPNATNHHHHSTTTTAMSMDDGSASGSDRKRKAATVEEEADESTSRRPHKFAVSRKDAQYCDVFPAPAPCVDKENVPITSSSSNSSNMPKPTPFSAEFLTSIRGMKDIPLNRTTVPSPSSGSGSSSSGSGGCSNYNSSNSNGSGNGSARMLPSLLQKQILKGRDSLNSSSSSYGNNNSNSQWMRPTGRNGPMPRPEEEKHDMRSILEKRIGEMRKFLDVDQDNVTATETMDITGFNDYF